MPSSHWPTAGKTSSRLRSAKRFETMVRKLLNLPRHCQKKCEGQHECTCCARKCILDFPLIDGTVYSGRTRLVLVSNHHRNGRLLDGFMSWFRATSTLCRSMLPSTLLFQNTSAAMTMICL